MRFQIKNVGKGDCLCGKKDVNLNLVVFDEDVEIITWNGKTFAGKTFALGNDCLFSFTLSGTNPLQVRQAMIENRESRRLALNRELCNQFKHEKAGNK